MTPTDVAREAVAALTAHRLRATLSSIGIVFGVATVVAALAIGEGARREAFEEIGALGAENVFVRALGRAPPADSRRKPAAPALTLADARILARTIAGVKAVAAVRSARTEATANGLATDAQLVGVTPAWRDVAEPALQAGRWLTDDDVRERRRIVVLGNEIVRRLFRTSDPIGSRVRAAGASFHVVGVFASRTTAASKRSTIQRVDVDRAMVVPLAAMDVSLGEGDSIDRVEEIAVRAAGAGDVDRVSVLAAAVMRSRLGAQGPYELVVPRELLRTRLRAQRTFNGVLIGIGGLALVISGIGIMNIMLAGVAERTQEIGVRRAFGATRRAVVLQFAAEAALLCVAGGVAGLPVGAALAAIVALLAGWPIAISPLAVVLALALSTSVGLVFGVYPARLAASIQPIDALRAP